MSDPGIAASMNKRESTAWILFTVVANSFLGITKAINFVQLVKDKLLKFGSEDEHQDFSPV